MHNAVIVKIENKSLLQNEVWTSKRLKNSPPSCYHLSLFLQAYLNGFKPSSSLFSHTHLWWPHSPQGWCVLAPAAFPGPHTSIQFAALVQTSSVLKWLFTWQCSSRALLCDLCCWVMPSLSALPLLCPSHNSFSALHVYHYGKPIWGDTCVCYFSHLPTYQLAFQASSRAAIQGCQWHQVSRTLPLSSYPYPQLYPFASHTVFLFVDFFLTERGLVDSRCATKASLALLYPLGTEPIPDVGSLARPTWLLLVVLSVWVKLLDKNWIFLSILPLQSLDIRGFLLSDTSITTFNPQQGPCCDPENTYMSCVTVDHEKGLA